MSTVPERKKSLHTFMSTYPYLCRLQNITPSTCIKVNNSNNFLDFVGDRLKFDDWKPVLEAISNDRSLHFIGIRSRHSKAKILQDTDSEIQVRQAITPKSSPLFTNFMLKRISEALSECLSKSSVITGLLLEKIPLNTSSLNNLTQGLEACQNLQQLSLPYSQLGNDGTAVLCQVLRNRLNLVWLDLSGCGLTESGAGILCDLLKFQKLNRYGESWKQSLRCRPVNPNIMPGLRRLTLNHNPFGDVGIGMFVDTLVDDLWLKALDLQNCGITLAGGETLLNLVKENQFLSVVDVRGNIQVPNSIVAAIVQQLAENNTENETEFQWLKEDCVKNTSGSNTRSSVSKSTQRLLSTTTLSNKGLPNMFKKPVSQTALSSNTNIRSASANRIRTVNNSPSTPRPQWNWNGHTALRRGTSDQMINHMKRKPDIFQELQSIKEQLQKVTYELKLETERRIKIEKELDEHKKSREISDRLKVEETALKALVQYNCNDLSNKTKTSGSSNEMDEENSKEAKENCDSLESVIRTVNGINKPIFDLDLNKCSSLSTQSSRSVSSTDNRRSRAQLLLETLILN